MPRFDSIASARERPLKQAQAARAAADSARRWLGWRLLLLSFVTSGLLWMCYFPLAWGWLAWIALIPFLALVRVPPRTRGLYLGSWISGLLMYLASMQWMRVADPRMYATWIGLALYCSLYFPLALFLIRFLDRRTRLPLVVSCPLVWTPLEFLRSTFGGGFSWYMLGHTQHNVLPLIQIADVTGVYGVSFLIAAFNALLFEILWGRQAVRRWSQLPEAASHWGRIGLLVQGLAVVAALLGTVVYGFWRLGQAELTPGPRLALLQGNLDQRLRNESSVSEDAAAKVASHFRDLADLAAAYRPVLMVWPETSWPGEWQEDEKDGPNPRSLELAKKMAALWHTNLLVGMNAAVIAADGKPHRYNSAILIDSTGKPVGRYDKIHRVPFGEYVPFRDWLPWMEKLAPYDFDYSVWPGQSHTRFPLVDMATGRRFTFGVLICYEDTDAEVARPYGGGDVLEPAIFLLNISNDGWFDGTSEHDQHLAICRFRAIECRRSVARSVNMGISAFIDSNGRVLRPHSLPRPEGRIDPDFHVWEVAMHREGSEELPIDEWHEFKKVPGVLLAIIPVDNRVSLYARWGDWLPWSCWFALAGFFVAVLARRREKSHTESA
jgi:apolipoprotein N-acyltransferase